MQTDFLSPINLTVEPFTIGVDGAVSTPNPTQLINPNRSAMLVDEFKFSVGLEGFTLGADAHEFATVWAKLTYGSTLLTNQYIPLPAFAPFYFGYPRAALGNWGDCTLTWHLPRPLYVPPDVQVGVSFLRRNPFPGTWDDEFNVNQKWGFSINGRSMPAGMQIPEKVYVPWACATSILGLSAQSVEVPYTSNDADVVNPFDEPLNIDYFTGFNMGPDPTAPSTTPITVQMTLSNGKVLMRDPIPFNLLFPPDRPILRTRALLQPKEFVSVVVDVPEPIDGNNENAAFSTIGMTGWRELQTPMGALP